MERRGTLGRAGMPLLPYVFEGNLELVPEVLLNTSRNADAARLRYPFQTCRYVHSITENVATIYDDIANIDANAELDFPLLRQAGIAFSHPALHVDGAAHGVDHATELGQHSVAGVLDNVSTVLADLGIDEDTQMLLQLKVGALLVPAG
jgi:hypothetical protein